MELTFSLIIVAVSFLLLCISIGLLISAFMEENKDD